MTQPTDQITALARRYAVDIDMNVPGVADWQTLFGIEDVKPLFAQRRQDDEGYDDDGSMRQAITGSAERLEMKLKHRENGAGAFDLVHEHLRAKSRASNAIDGEIHLRWYDREGRADDAYDGRAIVEWTPDGGNGGALDTIALVLHIQGPSVAITNPAGSALPVVAALTPTGGPAAGGTLVTVKGTKLTGATAVTFGGTAATSFAVLDDTRIVAVSPAKAAGNADVLVTTPGGTSANTTSDNYLYA